MSSSVKDAVKAFIRENYLFGDETVELADDASLIENDIIGSTGVLELVAFVEEHFGVVMDDAEIVPANLDSVDRIVAYVGSKTSQAIAV